MSNVGRHPGLPAAILVVMTGLGLHFLPQTYTDAASRVVRDAALPGREIIDWCAACFTTGETETERAVSVANDGADRRWTDVLRRLRVKNASLAEEVARLTREGPTRYPVTPTDSLITPEFVAARVLGRENTELWQAGRWIDVGSSSGMRDSAIVVASDRLMIDAGDDSGFADGLPVYAGSTVVGRISSAGHWTSLVQPVTDPGFRGLAQLMREGSRGFLFGARGILEGSGDGLCRLKFISSSDAVSIGDEVYTADDDLAYPFHYGRVVAAKLPAGAPHWEITVEPAFDASSEPKQVQVLRRDLNPLRRLAN